MADRPMMKFCLRCGKKRAVIVASVKGVPLWVNHEKQGIVGAGSLICRYCGFPQGFHGPLFGEKVGEGEVKRIVEVTDPDARPIRYRVVA